MSITSCLVGGVHEIWPRRVGQLQVARISGIEVVSFFGTRKREIDLGNSWSKISVETHVKTNAVSGNVALELLEDATRLHLVIGSGAIVDANRETGSNGTAVRIKIENPHFLRELGEAIVATAVKAEVTGLFAQLAQNQGVDPSA
jgi:hypothetical protein